MQDKVTVFCFMIQLVLMFCAVVAIAPPDEQEVGSRVVTRSIMWHVYRESGINEFIQTTRNRPTLWAL